jgi:hypothetical protein
VPDDRNRRAEVGADEGVGAGGVDHEAQVPRPVLQVRQGPCERVVATVVAQMTEQRGDEARLREAQGQSTKEPRQTARPVGDEDQGQPGAVDGGVPGDLDGEVVERLERWRGAGGVKEGCWDGGSLHRVEDLERVPADVRHG